MSQPIRLKDHEKDARLVRSRVVVGAVAVVLLVCVLIARLYYLQVIQYDYHSTLSENNRVHVQPIPPTRGRCARTTTWATISTATTRATRRSAIRST